MKSAVVAILPAALFAIASCSPGIPGQLDTTVKRSATGTTVVDTYKATATVAAIDPASRRLKLILSDGRAKVVKCGPEVVNFPRIQVNDHVRITVTEEVAVYLDKGKPAADASGSGLVGLSPLGAKPGIVAADTVRATVKISAIDTSTRKLTVRTKEGETQILKAGDHINLGKIKVGDSVTIRRTEAIGLLVETL